MIKLTELLKEVNAKKLKEINLKSGDASNINSLGLLEEFIYDGPRDFLKLMKSLKIDINRWDTKENPVINDLPDPRIIEYIKSNSIESQGSLYVLTSADPENKKILVHNLFKIDEPLKTIFVGKIGVTSSEGPYSIKRMYGIDSKEIHYSIFAKEYKGLGYGSILYDTLLYRYGVLESDNTLYQGSQKMWMYHIPKVAKFFGGVVKHPASYSGGSGEGDPTLVIPLTVDDVMDRGFVKKALGSFVAFYDNIPNEIIKTATLSNGLSYREGTLGIMFYSNSIKDIIWDDAEKGKEEYDSFKPVGSLSFIDWLESEKGDTSFEEITLAMTNIADMSYYKLNPDAAQVIFVLAEDATVVITKKDKSYNYSLL